MARDLGDFQTPTELVQLVSERVLDGSESWRRVLEPTCGIGNFLHEIAQRGSHQFEVKGIEIQESHANVARLSAMGCDDHLVDIQAANLFDLDLRRDLSWKNTGRLLVVGNPPWVTNAELGVLGSENLPRKTNLKRLRGIDAITGQSNFDIAEAIWLKLIRELSDEAPRIALLCKTSVARNVLQYAHDFRLPIQSAYICRIDANRWFGAAVDACLFCVDVARGGLVREVPVYPDLRSRVPAQVIGFTPGGMVADLRQYERAAFADGICPLTWRQGLKHDAASVMELTEDEHGCLWNHLGEAVDVESEFVHPLLKGSDLGGSPRLEAKRFVLVTQRHPRDDTYRLQKRAPRLWAYLTAHDDAFARRKSSIYRGQVPYCLFGIGDYSFSSYKVGVAGLYKTPRFRLIGPVDGRPVLLDDTCYFVPCVSREQGVLLATLLNSPPGQDLLGSLIFSDSKRPITKKLLQRIDLVAVLHTLRYDELMDAMGRQFDLPGCSRGFAELDWPDGFERMLTARKLAFSDDVIQDQLSFP